jgi:hypothetical protein
MIHIYIYLVGLDLYGSAHFLKREKALINVRELCIGLSQKEEIQHMHPENLCATTVYLCLTAPDKKKGGNPTYARRAVCANSVLKKSCTAPGLRLHEATAVYEHSFIYIYIYGGG